MLKWFKRSLMALGALFYIIIPVAIYADSVPGEYVDGFGIFLVLLAFGIGFLGIVTGIGALFQWLSRRSSEKAKRGLAYEDAMLNRIMSRLDDEERGYLQGYLNAQSYETAEDYFYSTDEQSRQSYK